MDDHTPHESTWQACERFEALYGRPPDPDSDSDVERVFGLLSGEGAADVLARTIRDHVEAAALELVKRDRAEFYGIGADGQMLIELRESP